MSTGNPWRIMALAGLVALSGCRGERDAGDAAGAVIAPMRAGTLEDSIGPGAPAGEPATSFPAPSRSVADIVAPRWTNEDSRDDVGEFARVASVAGITAGTRVADIGAGDGYYVTRLSPMVGPSGRVYAEDIVPDYLTLLRERVRREKLDNVQFVRGEAHDPRLPAGTLDAALLIHMYHEIDQPFGLLWNLATAMKPHGRVVILDLDRPTFGHGTPPSLLRCEVQAVGYRELSFTRSGREEYVAVFEAPSPTSRPSPSAISAKLAAAPCTAARE